jgi:pyruvate formate lyase activating enzyme
MNQWKYFVSRWNDSSKWGDSMREAFHYRQEKENIYCELCPQGCRLKEGQKGICGTRRVEEGKLVVLNYNLCSAIAVDPIEKKPLYHFYPGWYILSLGTVGCNLNCDFCQNWTLARGEKEQEGMRVITPAKLLQLLHKLPQKEQLGVAYTYNEPTVWYEFVREAAELIKDHDYKNVLVTNGLINPKPLKELLPFIDALNIDVKAFRDTFYRRYCKGGALKDVLRTVETSLKSCHVELTYLIITSLNDSLEELKDFVDWVASLDPEIPVHFSRYFPSYRAQWPPTSLETMQKTWEIARERLSYVYLGNVVDENSSNTYCPACGELLLSRRGYHLQNMGLQGKECSNCGHTIRLHGYIYEEG